MSERRRRSPLLTWSALLAASVIVLLLIYGRSKEPAGSGHPRRPGARTLPPPRAADAGSRETRSAPRAVAKIDAAARRPEENPDETDEELEAAARRLDEALAVHPGDVAALERRGWLHLEADELREARDLAVRCLRADPSNDACRRIRALSYAREGEMESRIPIMKACLSAARTETGCLAAFVAAHARRGDIDGGRAVADELRALSPRGADTQLALGRLAEAEGRSLAARRLYERACDLGSADGCDRADELGEQR